MVTRSSGFASTAKGVVGMLLLAVGFVATLATALGFLGGIWWAFDLAADFRLQLGVVLVLTALLYWITVGQGAAVLFFAAGLVNLFLLIPLLAGSQATPATDERLDVVTFNVDQEVTERVTIIEWLDGIEADLVFLQETTDKWVETLAAADWDYEIIATPPEDLQRGITVLSRIPAAAEPIEVGTAGDAIVEITTRFEGETVTLIGVNAVRPTSVDAADRRDALFDFVAARVADRADPIAVVGDLGTTRWSAAFRALRNEGNLVNSEDGFGYQGTWPANDLTFLGAYLSLPTDHVLTSRSLTTASRETGPELGSSHLPLVVELALAGG